MIIFNNPGMTLHYTIIEKSLFRLIRLIGNLCGKHDKFDVVIGIIYRAIKLLY